MNGIIPFAALLMAAVVAAGADGGETRNPAVQRLSLREAMELALLNNRELQIQRIQPAIARLSLDATYGYYDPLLTVDTRWENASDSGGFDPADLSRDTIYTAESTVSRLGLIGTLPTGLRYTVNGDYAHSAGDRNGLNFDSYKLIGGIFVQQPLLKNFWIDQGRMMVQVSRRDLRITELGVQFATMSVLRDVQQAYHELQFARENAGVFVRLLDSRRRLLSGIQRKLQEGLGTVSEEKLARSQMAIVEMDVAVASNAVARAESQLKTLLGDAFTNPVEKQILPTDPLVAVPAAFDLLESLQRGVERRPDLAQLRQDVEKAGIDLKFRRNQLFPALDLIASYKRQGASAEQVLPPAPAKASFSEAVDQWADGESPSDMLGVIFSVPLSRKSERARFRAGRELKLQAELRVKQYEELVLREVSDALSDARSGLARLDAARRARLDAAASVEDEERRLLGGRSTLFFLLQVQEGLTRAETSEVRAMADYNRAVSQLHFAEGSLLEKARVIIEVK